VVRAAVRTKARRPMRLPPPAASVPSVRIIGTSKAGGAGRERSSLKYRRLTDATLDSRWSRGAFSKYLYDGGMARRFLCAEAIYLEGAMRTAEHLFLPGTDERNAIKRSIKDTRGEYYLYFGIGLGLPFVFWLVIPELEGLSRFMQLLWKFVFYGLPPLVSGTVLLGEEREIYYLNRALKKGITHFSDATVEKVNVPRFGGGGFKHLNSFSIKVAGKWYYVDPKTTKQLSRGDRIELKCIPKAGMVFEIKTHSDGGPSESRLIYRRKAGPPAEYDPD
jgi:hypothetical protein